MTNKDQKNKGKAGNSIFKGCCFRVAHIFQIFQNSSSLGQELEFSKN